MTITGILDVLGQPHFERLKSGGSDFGNESIVDRINPQMLYLVDSMWYQYPPLSTFWYVLIGLFMFCIGIISGIGNGLVVYIFTTTPNLRTPSNLLIVNLAFADFCMVFYMVPVMVYNSTQGTWNLGPLACSLYGVIGSMFGNCSIWTMVMIAIDRYNVIVKGISGPKLSIKSVCIIMFIIWVHGLIWTLAPVFGWNRYVPEGNMTSCGTDYLTKDWKSRSYILVYSVFAYFTPLFTIVWAYFHIVKSVADHERNMREQAKKMNVESLRAGDGGDTRAEIKIAKVSLMVIALWFMAWTPYLIVNYAGIFEIFPLSPLSTVLPAVFSKANAIYNPIVYAISHPKYRQALSEKCPFFCSADTSSKSDAASEKTAATKT
ncbi:rhodopsin-like [Planococcus citri]|uniref:rhodopsin-like n=1 Tax=Planococcus citri TaxID=170843 RepID=UPI0031F808B4